MFTGIIESTAKILNFKDGVLSVTRPQVFETLKIGQSIAVNGACLSVTAFDNDKMCFILAEETQRKTNLTQATFVNLEGAMPANARFEGHLVLGHIDGIATFIEQKGEDHFFDLPENLAIFAVEKGSIALNGVSLTIASVDENRIRVAIIPLTTEITNFNTLNEGDPINVEADYFAKLLRKWRR